MWRTCIRHLTPPNALPHPPTHTRMKEIPMRQCKVPFFFWEKILKEKCDKISVPARIFLVKWLWIDKSAVDAAHVFEPVWDPLFVFVCQWYACVCVFVCLCVCVCVCVWMYCVYVCIRLCVSLYLCLYTKMFVYKDKYLTVLCKYM
jgi:hypothetical protein